MKETENKHDKERQHLLTDDESRFQSLGITPNFWIWEVDEHGIYTYCSPNVYEILGYQPEEILGKTPFDFIIPEERNQIVTIFQNIVANCEPIVSLENSNLRKDGKVVIVETNGVPFFNESGDLLGYRGIDRNISRRKHAEDSLKENQKQLEMAMEMANLGIWEFDLARRGFHFDDQFYSLYGTTSEKYDGFISLEDFRNVFVHPDDRDQAAYEIMKAIQEKATSLSMELRIIRTDGEIRHVIARLLFSAPESNTSGREFGLMQDISSIKKAELELRELNASKDKFFSIIAHDLKNPFNTLIGLSEVLKDELKSMDTETIEKYVGLINNSAVQTFRLLENLLEWANSQRGKIVFNPLSVNLYDLVKTEINDLNDLAGEKSIELKNLLLPDIFVTADENMVKTIMRNLITNAIKFTPKNGKVEVKAIVSSSYTEISVSDNGIGMSRETIEKLFRLDENHSTRGTEDEKGTGLGLILCKEFIDKHHGRIWVESEPGNGSIFRFIIPLMINGSTQS